VRNWRVLTAVAAVVLAVLAGVLVWKYVDDQKEEAQKPYQQVEVLVASKRIPAGTAFGSALDEEQVTREKRVRKDLPPSYVPGTSTNRSLKQQYSQLVAAHDITEGLPIVSQDFVTAGEVQTGGVEGQLATDNAKLKAQGKQGNLQALTLTFDDTHAVGGFLSPGDRVNAIVHASYHFLDPQNDLGIAEGGSDKSVKSTSFLLPGLQVLAVGSKTSTVAPTATNTGSSTPATAVVQSRGLVTFEVTPTEAVQLIQASETGTLWLSLNPPTWKTGDFTSPEEVVEAVNLFKKPNAKVQDILNRMKSNP
jgi:Flp pilus assembly protein CpaB